MKLKELGVNSVAIENYVRRWLVYSILTSRYSGSPESVFDFDIKQISQKPFDEYLKESRGNRGASDAGTVIVNVNAGAVGDENIIIDAVQNALNEIARRGYTTTYAGAIAG